MSTELDFNRREALELGGAGLLALLGAAAGGTMVLPETAEAYTTKAGYYYFGKIVGKGKPTISFNASRTKVTIKGACLRSSKWMGKGKKKSLKKAKRTFKVAKNCVYQHYNYGEFNSNPKLGAHESYGPTDAATFFGEDMNDFNYYYGKTDDACYCGIGIHVKGKKVVGIGVHYSTWS